MFFCLTITFFQLILWWAKHSWYRSPKLLRQLCPRQALTKYFPTSISKLPSFNFPKWQFYKPTLKTTVYKYISPNSSNMFTDRNFPHSVMWKQAWFSVRNILNSSNASPLLWGLQVCSNYSHLRSVEQKRRKNARITSASKMVVGIGGFRHNKLTDIFFFFLFLVGWDWVS
jgi:hypothetical protein